MTSWFQVNGQSSDVARTSKTVHQNAHHQPTIMLFRSLIKSSQTAKPAFVQLIAPVLTRPITSSFITLSPPASSGKAKVVEGEAPLSKPPSDPNKLSARDLTEGTYEKELETSSEPITTFSGTRSYVVNEPDPEDAKYQIPTGAYHSTAPYEKPQGVRYGELREKEGSSTSSELAHPVTTGRVPRREAGAGLMEKEGTKEGVDWVLEGEPRGGKA